MKRTTHIQGHFLGDKSATRGNKNYAKLLYAQKEKYITFFYNDMENTYIARLDKKTAHGINETIKALQAFVDYLDSDLSEGEKILKDNAIKALNKIK